MKAAACAGYGAFVFAVRRRWPSFTNRNEPLSSITRAAAMAPLQIIISAYTQNPYK
jgi:hypothetical protein